MTNYYYLASDQKLGLGNASLDFVETEPWMIPGFDYPVQREIGRYLVSALFMST
jgi:hypothetical protein